MIGRTHGMHAEPITFGFKMAGWYEEMKRNLSRMIHARGYISVGKISGSVGTYAHLDPSIERYVCRRLGLRPAVASTQVVSRDHYAEFFATLAIIAASVERFTLEIRHLQRTEVGEVEEFFSKGQKGSSAMPHKRNPIASENLCGLARLVRGYALSAIENIALWHERDISHSSVERVIGPDSTILVDNMLVRFTKMMERLVIYPQKMEENLESSRGLIFSEGVLLALVEKGLTREEAYRIVQHSAMGALEEGGDFRAMLIADAEVRRYLKPGDINTIFDVRHSLRYIDSIYKRVFGR